MERTNGVRSLILIDCDGGQVFDFDSRSFKSKDLTPFAVPPFAAI